MQKIRHYQADALPEQHPLPTEGILIGELARLTGFTAKTIRYYESIGVLPDSTRGSNKYRYYTQADVNRLHLLRRLRLLGISLAEAKALIVETLDAACREVQHDLLSLVNVRIATLDQEIADLQHLRIELECCQQQLTSHPVQKDESFTTCYDQSCPACSPSPSGHPLTLFSPRLHGPETSEAKRFWEHASGEKDRITDRGYLPS